MPKSVLICREELFTLKYKTTPSGLFRAFSKNKEDINNA